MKRLNQTGSHILALTVGVLVIAAVAFCGYTVMQRNKSVDTGATATKATGVPASIKTTADLSAASKALDNSSAQLNNNLNDSSLDADMNDML